MSKNCLPTFGLEIVVDLKLQGRPRTTMSHRGNTPIRPKMCSLFRFTELFGSSLETVTPLGGSTAVQNEYSLPAAAATPL
jgi:hypothetical protein